MAEHKIEHALHRIPEEPHYIRKLWATDQTAFCNHLLHLHFDSSDDAVYVVSRQHRAMQSLARHFEADIKFEADQVTGRMIGRPPMVASRWEEKLDDAASLATSLVELHRRRHEATHDSSS